jgi:hypothetical protein
MTRTQKRKFEELNHVQKVLNHEHRQFAYPNS